jgi:hypothetical protein
MSRADDAVSNLATTTARPKSDSCSSQLVRLKDWTGLIH